MARRKKTAPAEDLMALLAKLPWWAGVALALASYLLLHRLAEQPLVVAAAPGQAGCVAAQAMTRGLMSAGQYVVPVICLFAASLVVTSGRFTRPTA